MAQQTSQANSAYGYVPNLPANIVGCVLFGIILLVQLGFGLGTQDWWMFTTWGITAGLELAGYIARAFSHKYATSYPLYEMQLICLIIAPAFMAAGIYYQLAKEISIYGQRYSPLKPMIYTAICTTCDVVSLFIQAAGGGVAAANTQTAAGPATGAWVVVGGIAFQVLTLLFFTVFFIFVSWQIFKDPNREVNWDPYFAQNRKRPLYKFWLPAVSVSLLFLLIRSIYRIVELSDGWTGYLIRTERFFLVLDGLMIAIGMIPLSLVYPAMAYGFVPVEGLYYRGASASELKRNKQLHTETTYSHQHSESENSFDLVTKEKMNILA